MQLRGPWKFRGKYKSFVKYRFETIKNRTLLANNSSSAVAQCFESSSDKCNWLYAWSISNDDNQASPTFCSLVTILAGYDTKTPRWSTWFQICLYCFFTAATSKFDLFNDSYSTFFEYTNFKIPAFSVWPVSSKLFRSFQTNFATAKKSYFFVLCMFKICCEVSFNQIWFYYSIWSEQSTELFV